MSNHDLFGRFFARMRRERTQLSLRRFCEEHGLDPGNMSRLERGKLAPPSSTAKLEAYARALGLQEGEDDWIDFFDLAAACRGEIPADIMADAELAEKLPVVFRTLRGDKVNDDNLDELAELIRKT